MLSLDRFLTSLLFVLMAPHAFSSGWQYVLDTQKTIPISEMILFQNQMQKMGFQPIDIRNRGNLPVVGVDQIFTDPTWEKTIFLKMHIKPSGAKYENQILPLNKGYVYHGKIAGIDISYALYFLNIKEEQVKAHAKSIADFFNVKIALQQKCSDQVQSYSSIFISKAWADPVCGAGVTLTPNAAVANIFYAQEINQTLREQTVLGQIGTCLIQTLQGIAAGIQSVREGMSRLLTNPRAFWADTVERFASLKGVISQIGSAMQSAMSVLLSMPPEIMNMILCSMVGALGPAIVKALSPTGTAALAASLAVALRKLTSSQQFLSALSRLHLRNPTGARGLSSTFGVCLAN